MESPPPLSDLLFPARDQSFGSVVRALSEPETGPAADNLVSNEDSYPRIAADVAQRRPVDGVYVGVGPDQNFTILAHAAPRLAFVLDYRRRNLLLHLVHKALFSLSENRVAYLSRLTARRPTGLPADPDADQLVAAFSAARFERRRLDAAIAEAAAVLQPLDVVAASEWDAVATIQAKLAGPGMNARFLALPMYPTLGRLVKTRDRRGAAAHLLANEDRYRLVRHLQRNDLVIPLVGDFGRPHGLDKLSDWLKAHRLRVGLLYISDVEFFLIRAGRLRDYADNLTSLPWADGALIARTSTREIAHSERFPGDSSTTIVRSVASFLEGVAAGKVATVDDLFAPEAGPR